MSAENRFVANPHCALEQIQDVRNKAEKRQKGTGDKARSSTTDPDARRMKMADGGFVSTDEITLAEQKGTTVFAPVKEEQKKRDQGRDPFARVKGDTEESAAWRARMGTVEARGSIRLPQGLSSFQTRVVGIEVCISLPFADLKK